ncbi:protein virilizer homolog isoform X1 [Alosa sapidissima]|uniref:protein virilizer homolog isoform X1 n=1 Tax=Alosa sapidissima TaxID=34773 RepID=UPI001C09C898|nr:protein virilizer homolog isoform X1 [Alosa sapidissima]
MAGDSSMELLFLDTFKHQSAELTNIDVVRFPCGVLVTEIRVIPPGIKAHSSLPDSRAFGETAPHAFQLDLFYNNLSKSNTPVFHRLGSLEYDENKSIVFRPSGKVNTDGLVLRGWYTCLTVAVYGTAERSHAHDRDTHSPPPPPPPPPQQPIQKRGSKHEWENEEQFNGSPPRPQPRGPRTPPGPPPPDDDDEETLAVQGPVKEESVDGRESLEPVSPEPGSVRADEPLSEPEPEEEEGLEPEEEEEEGTDEGSEPDEEEDEEEEMEPEVEEEEEEMDEEGEGGDDGYEQISSDEEDLESGAFKLPSFDVDYTAEDLASVPSVQYDPYERELRPLQHFTPPQTTAYEAQLICLKSQDLDDPTSVWAESAAKLTELLESGGSDELGPRWVMALEEVPPVLVKGLSFLVAKEPGAARGHLERLIGWACNALSLSVALSQPIALNLRQLKAGAKLACALADCGGDVVSGLLDRGVLATLLEMLFAEHVSSALKLNALRALNAVVDQPLGMQVLLGHRHRGGGGDAEDKETKRETNSAYQRLLELFLLDQTVRVVTAGAAVLQKGHFYELLGELRRCAGAWAEKSAAGPMDIAERESDEKEGAGDTEEREGGGPEAEEEGELERVQGLLEEMLHLLVTAPHCMLQPPTKAFPTTARITGPVDTNDPYPTLYRYMHACHFLESLVVVMSHPAACAHPGLVQVVRELLRFLSQSQPGLLFLLSHHQPTNLLLRVLAPLPALTHPLTHTLMETETEEAGQAADACSLEDSFWAWLVQVLHALQGVAELMEAGLEGEGEGLGEGPVVLSTLNSLYLISFSPGGRDALTHTLCLDNNITCLTNILQQHAKEGQGEGKVRKSVAYNYACMLLLLVVQNSNDIKMLENHGATLLSACKADDNNAKLLELGKWLEPLEKLRFDISAIPTLIDYIKQNIENLMTPEGSGLTTALRVLCHVACPPTLAPGQQKELKWTVAVMALFSGEGLDTFVRVLQKLCQLLLLPWRLHGPLGPGAQRVTVMSLACCTLRLLRTMLAELLQSGPSGGTTGHECRDARIPAVCVALHTVLCSTPATGRLDGQELRVQAELVDVLLTLTRAAGSGRRDVGSEETLAGNSWSLTLKEVLNSILAAPENIFSGLTLLSELLPLPLPMQTTQALSVQDVSLALNTRKLWSMHLQAQAGTLVEVLRSVAVSSCPPLQAMLRRVCVQLCDLAAPTGTLTVRTLLEQLQEELQPERVCPRLPRMLALLDSLASQRCFKASMLALLGGAPREGPVEGLDLLPSLLSLLLPPADASIPLQQGAELAASIIQSLCDQDISMCVSGSGEGCVSEVEQLANALPAREALSSICDGLLGVLGHTPSTHTLLLTCLRTLMILTEHDYGLHHLKSSLKKHSTVVVSLLKREIRSFSKDSPELLCALLDFLRQMLNSDSVDEEMDSRSVALSVYEMKQLLQWKEDSEEHALAELEKHVTGLAKGDDTLETLLEGLSAFRQLLESSTDTAPSEPDVEPNLPQPDILQTQYNHRTVYVLSDVMDEQLKALWFSPFNAEELESDLDMVKVDMLSLAQQCVPDLDLQAELEHSFLSEPTSPVHRQPIKGFRLGKHKHETFITSSGKSDYVEPAKRAHIMAQPRGRGRGMFSQGPGGRPHDIFRQRKQNTSRPPSMHVDDFLAAEYKDVGPSPGLILPKRPPKGGAKPPTRGLFTGGSRGGRGGFPSHTRFFTPPAPKSVLLTSNYPRREGGRGGSSWSAQVTALAHRATYSDTRGGQSNFARGPITARQPPAGAYRLATRDRAPRGRGTGLSWLSGGGPGVSGGGVSSSSGRGSQGKFNSGGRGRHVRSFTR